MVIDRQSHPKTAIVITMFAGNSCYGPCHRKCKFAVAVAVVFVATVATHNVVFAVRIA